MSDSRKKILIIEDDTTLQAVYKTRFEHEGYAVIQAFNGHLGYAYASEHKPDLILLDIMLPEGMNGFDVLSQLKQNMELQRIPVILLSNLDSEKESGAAMGAVDYVVKANTSIDELISKVKSHLS